VIRGLELGLLHDREHPEGTLEGAIAARKQ
jgi:hypothetical protein